MFSLFAISSTFCSLRIQKTPPLSDSLIQLKEAPEGAQIDIDCGSIFGSTGAETVADLIPHSQKIANVYSHIMLHPRDTVVDALLPIKDKLIIQHLEISASHFQPKELQQFLTHFNQINEITLSGEIDDSSALMLIDYINKHPTTIFNSGMYGPYYFGNPILVQLSHLETPIRFKPQLHTVHISYITAEQKSNFFPLVSKTEKLTIDESRTGPQVDMEIVHDMMLLASPKHLAIESKQVFLGLDIISFIGYYNRLEKISFYCQIDNEIEGKLKNILQGLPRNQLIVSFDGIGLPGDDFFGEEFSDGEKTWNVVKGDLKNTWEFTREE
jgi:hypothetical protein